MVPVPPAAVEPLRPCCRFRPSRPLAGSLRPRVLERLAQYAGGIWPLPAGLSWFETAKALIPRGVKDRLRRGRPPGES